MSSWNKVLCNKQLFFCWVSVSIYGKGPFISHIVNFWREVSVWVVCLCLCRSHTTRRSYDIWVTIPSSSCRIYTHTHIQQTHIVKIPRGRIRSHRPTFTLNDPRVRIHFCEPRLLIKTHFWGLPTPLIYVLCIWFLVVVVFLSTLRYLVHYICC